MNIQEFASKLNNVIEGNFLSKRDQELAKSLGFVVVYGYSDDNMEFRGAIDDETSCYNGGICYLTKDGLFEHCDCECKHSEDARKLTKQITAIWCDTGEYAWTYDTDIPHKKFDILDRDEGNKWCQGIVFNVKDL